MFWIFASPEKKMRDNAANWVELAEKIYHFRRDVLAPDQLSRLVHQTAALKAAIKQRMDAAKLKLEGLRSFREPEDFLASDGAQKCTTFVKSDFVLMAQQKLKDLAGGGQ